MGEKIVVGPINKGLRTDRTAFVIDNDSFPTLVNAYQWRGRIKRKRGTENLVRLTRYINSSPNYLYATSGTIITLSGAGAGNAITGLSLESSSSIIPGSFTVYDITSAASYTDNGDGTLLPSGTVNYATGAFLIAASAGNNVYVGFNYYPGLPVMGLEDFSVPGALYPSTVGFDTKYAYNILTSSPSAAYSISYYKNPSSGLSGYSAKPAGHWSPLHWNGNDYQQFFTCNYQGALWSTPGIDIPFTGSTIGMPFKNISDVTVLTATTAKLTIATHGLVVGDFVFINEVSTTTGINFQTGYVTTLDDANNVTVTFPSATIASNGTGGIAQYLTKSPDQSKDCIRWYDGDPTNSISPIPTSSLGWVNFCPPLSNALFSISDLPQDQYYLVGARIILPFKDRLLFIGPVVQTSSGSPKYLQDTVIYSQNGTPYYTSSFTGDAGLPSTSFTPVLVPDNQTAFASAWWEDLTGFGGYISAGLDTQIITAASNEDVLILGFSGLQTRFVYTGNDIVPFNFYVINSELGSSSTFSTVNMDKGVLSRGDRGFTMTSQTNSERFDTDVLDQVFQLKLTENGAERFCSQRDYENEWIYFTYPESSLDHKFPSQTLQYNYRDDSWAVFYETYTTYGQYKQSSGLTWSSFINPWQSTTSPWTYGSSTVLQPNVIAGNQQGFVLKRATNISGTSEANSLYISNISGTVVTSPNHCLNGGDYIIISGVLGSITPSINGTINVVSQVIDENTFDIGVSYSGTYIGGGLIQRMYVPLVQTKQFPVSWGMGRKTRIGVQQYLLTTTNNGQIQLLIYLSQDGSTPYNDNSAAPDDALVYSTVLYTCPELTNLGLTSANINLLQPNARTQQQIWHRINTSLIGDTVQLGFTLSPTQMTDTTLSNQFAEIEIHGMILDVSPSGMLA